jgi:hypothetical protein
MGAIRSTGISARSGPRLSWWSPTSRGFLELDRHLRDPQHPGIVRDTGFGINVYNDFDEMRSVEEQYEAVYKKYSRRIRRFRAAIQERTLLVSYILDAGEFDYLEQNMPDVLALLRRPNPQNDLLLVGNEDLPASKCGGLEVYKVAVDEEDVVARPFVRKNAGFRRKLLSLDYPVGLRLVNLLRYWWPLPDFSATLDSARGFAASIGARRLKRQIAWLLRVSFARTLGLRLMGERQLARQAPVRTHNT